MTLLYVYIAGVIISAGLVICAIITNRDIRTGKAKVNPFTSTVYIFLWPAVILAAIFMALFRKRHW